TTGWWWAGWGGCGPATPSRRSAWTCRGRRSRRRSKGGSMGDFFIATTISFAAVGLLGLLLWAAGQRRPVAAPGTGILVFRHGPLLRGFTLAAAFGIPLAITALAVVNPPKDRGDVMAIAGLYVLFAALSAPLLWEAMRFCLVTSPQGLGCHSPWRGRRSLPWAQVREVSYREANSWFVIHSRAGWKFHVPLWVPRLSLFLEQCERHLPLRALKEAAPGYARVRRLFPTATAGDELAKAQGGLPDALEKWARKTRPPQP